LSSYKVTKTLQVDIIGDNSLVYLYES